jgi:hypothetical protein
VEEHQVNKELTKERDLKLAEEYEAKIGLPKLKGKPSQVTWARIFRMKQLEEVSTLFQQNMGPFGLRIQLSDNLAVAIALLKSENSAKWWLDHKDSSVRELLRECII